MSKTEKSVLCDLKNTDPYSHIFPAVRGIQAGREYYCAMCPLGMIPKLFKFNENSLPPKIRSQRLLNHSRVPAISKYLTEDPKNYVFSSITASIDGKATFQATQATGPHSKVGILAIPMTATVVINDGQHRRAAIEEALKAVPTLASEHISVVFFIDGGLKRSQQMFADLNKNAIKPSKSLGILYNHRDPLTNLCEQIIEKVDVFSGRIDLEHDSISNRARDLFTLSSLYKATKAFLDVKQKNSVIDSKNTALAIRFWQEIANHMPQWKEVIKGKLQPYEFRQNYVNAHGIALNAIGIVGRALVTEYPGNWQTKLTKLDSITWLKSNKIWEGRVLSSGNIHASNRSLNLMTIYLKKELGITLSTEEQTIESSIVNNLKA
ncbi:MAG: DNA sulfur modification protein DndB [Candidatus Bathyarchaeota archaeon]|nr:DNA sulfur modification protein DndB [Candidatus Termiticorpusculum sp.]